MTTINDVIRRDLSRPVEEIVKVGQADEDVVFEELDEYVATDSIKRHYRNLLSAIADSHGEPNERTGIWVSGFFGSGKSLFAKNLGHALAGRTVHDRSAADLFAERIDDEGVRTALDFIRTSVPFEVIMFDVQVDRAIRSQTEKISEVVYTVVLRKLGYASDHDVAELEFELEADNRLGEFERTCSEIHGQEWSRLRLGTRRFNAASAVLHRMDPKTHATPDSWSDSVRGHPVRINVAFVVKRTLEMLNRRVPGKSLLLIIDEVGQYVSRSLEKIEDLRALVEEFGRVGRNWAREDRLPAPVWLAVTSQEKLEDVVAAIDGARIELARLQDRFQNRIDLSPADIREVATKRILAKKDDGVRLLRDLFERQQGQISLNTRLAGTSLSTELTADAFIESYPYLPHYIDLSIDIISGIRLQPGASTQLGGSNRTIIKQAYEMLAGDRTAMASQPLGRLVTLDLVYELVEGNLRSEIRQDIDTVDEQLGANLWCGRVARAIALLDMVRNLPRSPANIAAVLYDEVGGPSALPAVEDALKRLAEAEFVAASDTGYRLLTRAEKDWQRDRERVVAPNLRQRSQTLREAVGAAFSKAHLDHVAGPGGSRFRLKLSVNDVAVGPQPQGGIPLSVRLVEADEVDKAKNGALADSRERHPTEGRMNQYTVYWVAELDAVSERLATEVFRSNQMISQKVHERAAGSLSTNEAGLLDTEQRKLERYRRQLREAIGAAVAGGESFVRGVRKGGPDLGTTLAEVFHEVAADAIPQFYEHLEEGQASISGGEPEELLKAANLQGLSAVFYQDGLNLVVSQGEGRYVPNTDAAVPRRLLEYIRNQHSYGDRVTGKNLENQFGGFNYGWELDVVRLGAATLLRANAIEITYQGRRFRSHQDPQIRGAFATVPAFRAATFAPRGSIGLQALAAAVRNYEELTGETVDIEETAIASAVQRWAATELEALVGLSARAEVHELPVRQLLSEYRQSLEGLRSAASDEAVASLSGEGQTLGKAHRRVQRIDDAVANGDGLARIASARRALRQLWPTIRDRQPADELAEDVRRVEDLVDSEDLFERIEELTAATERIVAAYDQVYDPLAKKRAEVYADLVNQLTSSEDWHALEAGGEATATTRGAILEPLKSRADHRASQERTIPMEVLESDIAAAQQRLTDAVERVVRATTPAEQVQRVRVRDVLGTRLETEEDIDTALGRLKETLLDLVSRGVKIILE